MRIRRLGSERTGRQRDGRVNAPGCSARPSGMIGDALRTMPAETGFRAQGMRGARFEGSPAVWCVQARRTERLMESSRQCTNDNGTSDPYSVPAAAAGGGVLPGA